MIQNHFTMYGNPVSPENASGKLKELHGAGYSDKTIDEIIVYATGFSGIAKRLNTYLVKE